MARLLMLSGTHHDDRRCSDCKHLCSAVSWWCKSPEAIAMRGTSIPGVFNCPHWSPCPKASEVGWFSRTFGDWIKFRGQP